jgi:hypothetical protein
MNRLHPHPKGLNFALAARGGFQYGSALLRGSQLKTAVGGESLRHKGWRRALGQESLPPTETECAPVQTWPLRRNRRCWQENWRWSPRMPIMGALLHRWATGVACSANCASCDSLAEANWRGNDDPIQMPFVATAGSAATAYARRRQKGSCLQAGRHKQARSHSDASSRGPIVSVAPGFPGQRLSVAHLALNR